MLGKGYGALHLAFDGFDRFPMTPSLSKPMSHFEILDFVSTKDCAMQLLTCVRTVAQPRNHEGAFDMRALDGSTKKVLGSRPNVARPDASYKVYRTVRA